MSSLEGYGVKASHADDVEETLPFSQPMVDAAEKQNVAIAGTEAATQNAIVIKGLWFSPGKDAVDIYFLAQGGLETRSVHFGKIEEGDGSKRGSGYQLWVPLDSDLACGLAVGFHYSNITTSTLKPHWLLLEGCGVWRCHDHCISFVLQNVNQHSSFSQRLTWDLMPYSTIAEFNQSTGIE